MPEGLAPNLRALDFYVRRIIEKDEGSSDLRISVYR